MERARQIRISYDLSQYIKEFAIEHKDVDRKEFKNKWGEFMENKCICEIIDREYFDYDKSKIWEKMFVSARYYYRKKAMKPETTAGGALETDNESVSVHTNESKRKYVKTDRVVLNEIDEHLATLEKGSLGFNIEPEKAFMKFLVLYGEDKKIYKKTYKNRFYVEEKRLNPNGK